MKYGIWRKSREQDKNIPATLIDGWCYRWACYDNRTPTVFFDINEVHDQANKSNALWNEQLIFYEVKEYPL